VYTLCIVYYFVQAGQSDTAEMRLTGVLLKESYRWKFRTLWKTKGRFYDQPPILPSFIKDQGMWFCYPSTSNLSNLHSGMLLLCRWLQISCVSEKYDSIEIHHAHWTFLSVVWDIPESWLDVSHTDKVCAIGSTTLPNGSCNSIHPKAETLWAMWEKVAR